jgi:hypothetical protein
MFGQSHISLNLSIKTAYDCFYQRELQHIIVYIMLRTLNKSNTTPMVAKFAIYEHKLVKKKKVNMQLYMSPKLILMASITDVLSASRAPKLYPFMYCIGRGIHFMIAMLFIL